MDSLTSFQARLQGRVFVPGDPSFADRVAGFNTAVRQLPQVAVTAGSVADVVEAIAFARASGYPVSVQSTGHGAHVPITAGLLLSTRNLDEVHIDAPAQIATLGGGVRWKSVVTQGAAYGLAPIAGSSVDVGAVGYLLGGGLGPLARSHGFSSDYVTGFTVVTGTGQVVQAAADENADLFWALRGGKDGLGVVTQVRVRLVALPAAYGGALWFHPEHMETALRGWIAWTRDADPLVTTSVAIMQFPALDAVPAPFRGQQLLSLRFAYPGTNERGAQLAAPLRALAPVYVDALGDLPMVEIGRIHNDPGEPGPSWIRGMMLTHADQDLATALLKQVGAGTKAPFVSTEIRHLGEATTRDVPEGSAVGGRAAAFTLAVVANNPPSFAASRTAADGLMEVLRPWISPLTNINFVGEPHAAGYAARAWSPDMLARLNAVRKQYDPDGVFARTLG